MSTLVTINTMRSMRSIGRARAVVGTCVTQNKLVAAGSFSPFSTANITPPDYPVIPRSNFGPYTEYSVIHTDRSLNLMSDPFKTVMRNLNELLQYTYSANQVAIVPGSGTFGMEAVARQYANGKDANVMVLRNGWFSYRWTEILDMMQVRHTVLKAQPLAHNTQQYQPMPIDQVLEAIRVERPNVFFCPHVETSTGMILPDSYISQVSSAVHAHGGMLVLDCIASGTVWVDMLETGVDVLISAPQKGWTGPPCVALVMLSDLAAGRLHDGEESSFALSLKRWCTIMEAYDKGGFAYHTTMPTDALRDFHEVTVETLGIGLPELKKRQLELGQTARAVLNSKGLVSVAADGYQAPGVLVYHSPPTMDNPAVLQAFQQQGLQIAMGVPWKIDEPNGLKTFRIGLFGLDKLMNIEQTVETMEIALDQVLLGETQVVA